MRSGWRLSLFVALWPLAALAQTRGEITGTIVEAGSQAPLAGAVVIATSEALQGERSASTGPDGAFELRGLPPGSYVLDVQAREHQSFTLGEVRVRLDRTVRLRLQMTAAQEGAAVGSRGERPAIAADPLEARGVISRDRTELVPYGRESRSFEDAAVAVPGVLPGPDGIAVPGSLPGENRTLIDGLDVSGPVGRLPPTRLPQRFIDELAVLYGPLPAELGRASGAIVHTALRSGGNDFHGSVFTDALPFELSRRQPGAAVSYALQPGFELGGPLQRDRLWFYGGVAPEIVAFEGGTRTATQYVGKLTFRPADEQSLSLSTFGDPGSGQGSNDLALRYQGFFRDALVEGSGGWHHFRPGEDRVEGALAAGQLVQLAGTHRFKAGVQLARESAGAADQTFLAGYAQDRWSFLQAFWLDAGVRYETLRGTADSSAVLPRLAAAWDFTGRGLSRVYAGWGRSFRPEQPGAAALVEDQVSTGAQWQFYRDASAWLDYTHRPGYHGVTLAVGKPLSENYLLQASCVLASLNQDLAAIFRLELGYLYEWTARTSVSLGAAVHAQNAVGSTLGLDARASVRHALTSTYLLALNLDVINAFDRQGDPLEQPLAVRLGAALSF